MLLNKKFIFFGILFLLISITSVYSLCTISGKIYYPNYSSVSNARIMIEYEINDKYYNEIIFTDENGMYFYNSPFCNIQGTINISKGCMIGSKRFTLSTTPISASIVLQQKSQCEDFCITRENLTEFYLQNNQINYKEYTSKYGGCVDGEWNQCSISERCNIVDVDNDCDGFLPNKDSDCVDYFDWRYNNGNWMTKVKDQSNCGSCWAFATVGSLESLYKLKMNNPLLPIDFSEQDLVSCSSSNGCNGGSPEDALDYINESGIVNEPCFPYNLQSVFPPFDIYEYIPTSCNNKCTNNNQLYQLKNNWNYVDNEYYSTRNENGDLIYTKNGKDYTINEIIKQNLIGKGPLIVSFYMCGLSLDTYSSKQIWYCPTDYSNCRDTHVVVLVGYQDTSAGGYWILKNSWGTNFGNDGYFRLAYGNCGLEEMGTIETELT